MYDSTVKQLIPVSNPDLSELEKRYLNRAFDSGWISSTGEFVEKFEYLWAKQIGSKHALAVANGTVALHLALASLGIGAGDEVIVPNLTFVATVNAVKYVGATPILVDVNLNNWGMSLQEVEKKITKSTKAVVCVHLYGVPCDVLELRKICDTHGIYLIEDAAEAPFSLTSGHKIGSIGDISTFSFYGNKIITSGEGGAVCTSNLEILNRMKLLRDQGMDTERRYFFIEIGFNFRLTNLQCAILVAQIERLEEILSKRRNIFAGYDELLRNNKNIIFQEIKSEVTLSPWLYTFRFLNLKKPISVVREDLEKVGIDTRPVFIPISDLPPYRQIALDKFQVSRKIAANGLSIPTFNSLSKSQIQFVGSEISKIG